MSETKLRNRHRLSKREMREFVAAFENIWGFHPFQEESGIDIAETDRWTVMIHHDEIVGVYFDDKPFPTVRGLLRITPSRRYVTVDMGAVVFVVKGADVMAPGIVDADRDIRIGDGVWIRDERNGKPIAVGMALVSGGEMIEGRSGKAVKSLHHVGDELWRLGQP